MKTTGLKSRWALFLAALSLWGCQGSAPEEGVVSSAGEAKIFGGVVLPPRSVGANKVVGLRFVNASGKAQTCTGTLIGSQIIVTAAHCVAPDLSTEKAYFITDLAQAANAPAEFVRNVVRAAVPSEYKAASQRGEPRYRYDIAVLKIDRPAPSFSNYMKLPEKEWDENQVPSLYVAGFGAESYNKLTGVATGDFKLKAAVVARKKSDIEGIIQLDQSQGQGTCIGDSGGPAYAGDSSTGYFLIGVLSAVVNSSNPEQECRGVSYHVSVARWSSWISAQAMNFSQSPK
jgi:secreted trypsin-like serine protease